MMRVLNQIDFTKNFLGIFRLYSGFLTLKTNLMKTIQIIVILIFSNVTLLLAQQTDSIEVSVNQNIADSLTGYDEEIVDPFFEEEPATFRGGDIAAFRNYVQQCIVLPADYKGSGKVVVQFYVNEHGKIVDIKILKGVNSLLDNEVIRVIQESNKQNTWKPAKQEGKLVKQYFVMPVAFNHSINETL
jgi:TonB family protein